MSDLQRECPKFGRDLRTYFGFRPGYTNLNSGAMGSVPKHVALSCERLTAEIEENPDLFMWFKYWPMLDEARGLVARLVGADTSECVFVPSVSHGINTVLRNFSWDKNDYMVITNCTFNTVNGVAHNISDMPPHPGLSEFPLHFPEPFSALLERFREHLRGLKARQEVKANDPPEKRSKIVVLMDSVLTTPSVLMPWKEMVKICKEEGAWSVLDAAHSIGQEKDLDLTKAGPDFWVTSCMKWLYTKRPCAVLYVPKRNQHIIKTALPTGLMYERMKQSGVHNLGETFKWPGSPDMIAPLSVKPALEFREFLGGEEKINAYCHDLALAGGRRMAEIFGTSMMHSAKDEEDYNLCMVNVELPMPSSLPWSWDIIVKFQDRLINQHNTFATQLYHNNKWWTRPSAQVYNELEDFEKLARALLVVCKEIVEEAGRRT